MTFFTLLQNQSSVIVEVTLPPGRLVLGALPPTIALQAPSGYAGGDTVSSQAQDRARLVRYIEERAEREFLREKRRNKKEYKISGRRLKSARSIKKAPPTPAPLSVAASAKTVAKQIIVAARPATYVPPGFFDLPLRKEAVAEAAIAKRQSETLVQRRAAEAEAARALAERSAWLAQCEQDEMFIVGLLLDEEGNINV